MSRGANGRGTRGAGRVARSESPQVRAVMSQKSIDIKNVGNLAKSKPLIEDAKGNLIEGEDVPPTQELLKMAGQDLSGAEKVIANSEVEHGAIYTDDGKQVMIKTSHDRSAVFLSNKEMKAMKGKVFTHNHPVVDGVSLPFSRADVTLLHFTKAREFRAVAGKVAFSLSPPEDSKFWKMKESAVDKMLNSAREVAFASLGYTPDRIPFAKTADLAVALDKMLTMVDRKLNLGYKKTNL